MAATKYIIGLLIVAVLSASIYVALPDNVKLEVKETSTVFSQWEGNKWVPSATEYVYLWDGSTKMRASSRLLDTSNDGRFVTVTRTSLWKDNIKTVHSYVFDSTVSDKEQVPIDEYVVCENCAGKIVNFEFTNFGEYDGLTKDISSPYAFGNKMKVSWQEGSTLSKVYQYKVASDKIEIKYKVKEDVETFKVRLFDPDFYTELCYQETANVSTGCGGLDTGNYTCSGLWASPTGDCGYAIDGNWSSLGWGLATNAGYIYVNYTKPINATNASFWAVKDENGLENLTIPTACWDYDADILTLRAYSSDASAYSIWDCMNDTDWFTLRENSGVSGGLYEEAMWWNLTFENITSEEVPTLDGVNLSKYAIAANNNMGYNGLVGWWKLEKGNGTYWNDSSGNSNFGKTNGTITTAPTYTAEGSVGGSQFFNASNNQFIVVPNLDVDSPFSVSLWFKTLDSSATQGVFSSTEGTIKRFAIVVQGTSVIGEYYNGSISSKSGAYIPKEWNHIVVTYNNLQIATYINGVSQSGTAQSSVGANVRSIIGNSVALINPFNGSIDEVMFWNRSLSQDEITKIYEKTSRVYTFNDLGASVINSSESATNTAVSYVYDWRLFNQSIAIVNFPFDNNGTYGNWTNVKDYSTNSYNLAYNGSAQAMPRWNRTGGYDGSGAYEFNGIDKGFTTDNIEFNYTNMNLSISAWVKMGVDTNGYVVAHRNGLEGFALFYSGGKFYFLYNSTQISVLDTLQTETWYHVVGRFNGTAISIFLNGVEQNSQYSSPESSVSSKIYVGLYSGSAPYLNGSIDNAHIFNVSLSTEQIKEMYADGFGGYNRLVSQETEIGDNWTVAVTPTNGDNDGEEYISNIITIEQDSCSCPLTAMNWVMNADDNCNIITDCAIPGYYWIISGGPGRIDLNAKITALGLLNGTSGQSLMTGSSARLIKG